MRFGVTIYSDVIAAAGRFERAYMQKRASGASPYYIPHPKLGWTIATNAHHSSMSYSSDSSGFRLTGSRKNTAADAERTIYLAGDSFVHGDELSNEDSWVWLLQNRLGPDYRVINGGVSGYGTDQAALRFFHQKPVQTAQIAVLALTTTDMYRNLNVCRTFLATGGDFPFLKPRFHSDSHEKPQIVEPPEMDFDTVVATMLRPEVRDHLRVHDCYYPSLKRNILQVARRFSLPVPSDRKLLFENAVETTLVIAKWFAKTCRDADTQPLFLMLPAYWGAYPSGKEMEIFDEELRAGGELVIDAREVFTHSRLQQPPEVLHCPGSHYTRISGGWIADLVCSRLKQVSNEQGRLAG